MDSKGLTIVNTLEPPSATNPKTRVAIDVLRKQRMDDPDWKMFLLMTEVCRSYPRWANIGLTPKVMPFKIPLAIFASRTPDKRILVLEPTNAHFHEREVATPEEGIFYDVADEVRKNIHYSVKCTCSDLSSCTCTSSADWAIHFLKCREYPPFVTGYPEIIDCSGSRDVFSSIFVGQMENLMKEGRESLYAPSTDPLPWEMKETLEIMDRFRKESKDIQRPPPSESLNPFEPLSIVNCENCGRDENTEGGDELKRCGRCKQVRYCSLRCQTMDWPRHKKGCVPPPVNVGKGILLMPTMTFDPVTKQLVPMMAEKKPKLEKKKGKKDGDEK